MSEPYPPGSNSETNLKIRLSSSGVHIFNRMTGLNILLDEVKIPPELWSRAPRHVSIALTNQCDLSCPYCFSPKEYAALEFNVLAQWLLELDQNGCIGVGFGGGEPTLFRHLLEICRFVKENTNMAITLTTHAHNIGKYNSSLKGYVNFMRVSMDGVGSTYERLRNRSFTDFCDRLIDVKTIAPFGINYIINSQTIDDLDNALVFAKEMGAVEFLLLPEMANSKSDGIDDRTEKTLKHWIANYNGHVPLMISENGAEDLLYCNPFSKDIGLSSYAHIDATGMLKKTSFDCEGIIIDNQGVIKAIELLKSKH